MYDDYTELRPGAATRLESVLREYFGGATVGSSNTNGTQSSRFVDSTAKWLEALTGIPDKLRFPRLPQHHSSSPRPTSLLGVCTVIPNTPPGHHNFMLLCIPFMKWGLKLYQPEVCKMNSDQEFFQVLRYYYASQRGVRSWIRLRTVRAIKFVKVSGLLHGSQERVF